VKRGIEVWVGTGWVFVEAKDREEVEVLYARSVAIAPTRRVLVTEDGLSVCIDATA